MLSTKSGTAARNYDGLLQALELEKTLKSLQNMISE